MTLIRTNPSNWGVGDKLSSDDANSLDLTIVSALDKRTGRTDTLGSIVQCTGAGRLLDTYVVGTDGDTTYLLGGANSIIHVTTLTGPRTYRLSDTGAQLGARLMVLNTSSFPVTIVSDQLVPLLVLGASTQQNAESRWGDFIWTGIGTYWKAWRSAKPVAITPVTFTANGVWTCPVGITSVLIDAWGGGGGGGSGANGINSSTLSACGGSGGGGSVRSSAVVAVTPGTIYAVNIGAGGTPGYLGLDGGDGGDTSFDGTVAVFAGAGGGTYGFSQYPVLQLAWGGTPVRMASLSATRRVAYSSAVDGYVRVPSHGGAGFNSLGAFAQSNDGNRSPQNYVGGVGGLHGVNIGAGPPGGGGGGGGGAGPGSAGSNGGAGGNGIAGNNGANGSAGVTPSGNGGAGGGGGGGGGSGSMGVLSSGAAGGSGSPGQLTVIPFR